MGWTQNLKQKELIKNYNVGEKKKYHLNNEQMKCLKQLVITLFGDNFRKKGKPLS